VVKERKFWEILAESQHDKLVLSWLSVVLTVLVIVLSALLVSVAIRPKPVVVVPGAAIAGVYNAGEMPETVMVHFARNFVVDLANYTPASAEKGYLSAARYMSPELLSRFEPIARAQLKQVVTNRISQFFAVDSEKVANQGPWHRQVERFERSLAIERLKRFEQVLGVSAAPRPRENRFSIALRFSMSNAPNRIPTVSL